MDYQELKEQSIVANIALWSTRRRYRNPIIAASVVLFLSLIWLSHNLLIRELNLEKITIPLTDGFHPRADHLLSSKIWQILLPKNGPNEGFTIDPANLQYTASWLAMNPGYAYTLVGSKWANEFIRYHFQAEPSIIEMYDNLKNVGMKSDFLRYLILSIEGGVYTDTDTLALKTIDDWIPQQFRYKARLVVGIEFDRRDGGLWADIPHWVQFCQWTIAAAPGHQVFRDMISRIMESANEMSQRYGQPINRLKPTSFDVMNSTGPAAWTDVVFKQLQQFDLSLETTKDLAFMREPKLYGDILVLSIDGFGMGQVHSHSTHDGTVPEAALMKHLFKGTWRGD